MPALILQTVQQQVSHILRYIYLRARSQTQVHIKYKGEDNTSGLAGGEILTAGPGPRA